MEQEQKNGNIEQEKIDLLIKEISNSAIEFRTSAYTAIFKRLQKFFARKNKNITRDTELIDILGTNFSQAEWKELNQIGLRMPELQRSKLFDKVTWIYLILAGLTFLVLAIKNYEFIFVLWGFPIIGIITTVIFSPIILFLFIFKRSHLPCDTIDELIEIIISINWTDLVSDEKKLLKEIIKKDGDY